MVCDLCGSIDFSPLSQVDRKGRPLVTGICNHCGLISHIPLPSEEEIARYYAQQYRNDYHGERTPSDRRIMRAWNNGERICNQIKDYLSKQTDVFEIGAGIGCTVKQFELHGFRATGIEPNHDFNAFTREKLHANVENTNLFDLTPDHQYNAILLIHVIEHFVSPSKALQHIHALLKEGGLLYVECPNVAGPFATFDRLFHYAHIYNFAHVTLQQIAHKCGFELVQSFTDDGHPDLQMLFRKSTPSQPAIEADQSEKIRQATQRFGMLSYHLRPAYLSRRLKKVASYAWEYAVAPGFVRKLLLRTQS